MDARTTKQKRIEGVQIFNMDMFAWRNSGGIWMVWRNAEEFCERKTLFRMKKEAKQVRFKGTRTEPILIPA